MLPQMNKWCCTMKTVVRPSVRLYRKSLIGRALLPGLLWLAAAPWGNWWWSVGDGRKQQRSLAKRELCRLSLALLTTSFTSPRGLTGFPPVSFSPSRPRTMTCVEILKASKEDKLFNVFYIDSYLPCFFFCIFLLHVWNSVYKSEHCALVRYSMQPNSKFINKIYLKWIFKWDYLVNLPTWIRIADLMRLWHAHT